MELYLLKGFLYDTHYVKSVRIWSFSGPHFPAFGLNMERYSVFLRIQSECGKVRTSIISNTDTFYFPMLYIAIGSKYGQILFF